MFNSLQNQDIFKDALIQWGIDTQALMSVGEMAELTDNIIKRYVQGREINTCDIIKEIADVVIMMAQLSIHFGVENVDYQIKAKLNKLSSHLQKVKE